MGYSLLAARYSLLAARLVDDEFEKVAVGIADVGARSLGLASALARDRTFLYSCAGGVEPWFELGGCAVPHEAEIAAWRLRGGVTQREAAVLPPRWTMEVDHLAAGIDGNRGRRLADIET